LRRRHLTSWRPGPQDEANRFRATMRTQLLHDKSHSVPHNIITGEARQSPAQLMASASVGQQQQHKQ
jgi:hypothetical protein